MARAVRLLTGSQKQSSSLSWNLWCNLAHLNFQTQPITDFTLFPRNTIFACSFDMAFCDLCIGMTVDKLYPPHIYHHGENLAIVEQSAKTCQLCKLIHWCMWRDSERESVPMLHFEGADEEMVPYAQNEERNKCSIKLQIIAGTQDRFGKQGGFKHIGIWMKSKYMISDLRLVVEEGIKITLHSRCA